MCLWPYKKNPETMSILGGPSPQEMKVMNSARADGRLVKVREQIMRMLQRLLEVWSKDALVYNVGLCPP
jgi:hypothetical protein